MVMRGQTISSWWGIAEDLCLEPAPRIIVDQPGAVVLLGYEFHRVDPEFREAPDIFPQEDDGAAHGGLC